jgi:predicted ATPase
MIRRVRIQGYKSLKDAEITLGPLTVILGPNAAGKTNLFDALRLLARIVTGKNVKEAFEAEEHRGVPLEAFYLLAEPEGGGASSDTARFTMEMDVELSPEVISAVEDQVAKMREGLREARAPRRVIERRLRYSITVELVLVSGYLRVRDEKLVALNEDGTERQTRRPFLERVGSRLRLRMEGQARPTEHDIGMDYALVSAPLYPPHYSHITAFREELSRWRFYYLEPREMRAEGALQELRSLAPSGAGLAAFFNTLKVESPKQFESVQRTLHTLLPPIDQLDVEHTRRGFLDLRVVEEGVRFSSRVISEGTLRILGLLAITNPISPVTVIGYEEPENGVHAHRLGLIARMLATAADGGKQVLINTHSPLLVRHLASAARLVLCRRTDHETKFEPYEGGPLFLAGAAEEALAEEESTKEPPPTDLFERVVRGDFGT